MSASNDSQQRHLEVMGGPEHVLRFAIANGTTIGRGAENDIQLYDRAVSRRHVRLNELPDGSFELVDLGSTNGTKVDGRKVRRIVLAEGMVVVVGATRLRFGVTGHRRPNEPQADGAPGGDAPRLRLVSACSSQEEEHITWTDEVVLDEIMSYRALRLRRIRGALVDEAQRVCFDNLHEALTNPQTIDRRIYARFSCSFSGRLERVGGPALECRVEDVAVDGARVRVKGDDAPGPGSVLWLSIMRGDGHHHRIPTRVQWQREDEAGLAFAGEAELNLGSYREIEPERRHGLVLGRIPVRSSTEAGR